MACSWASSAKIHAIHRQSRECYGVPRIHAELAQEHGMDARDTVALARLAVDRMDLRRQCNVLKRTVRERALIPRIKTARRDPEQPAHHPYRIGGLVRFHESVEGFVFGATSWANQAAAFDRISRSSFNCRTSRLSFTNSVRSALVRPPSPRPASRSACLTQPRIDQTEQPNSLLSCFGGRPVRTSSTICCLNSGEYRLPIFDLAIAESSSVNYEQSTKAGQLQVARCARQNYRARTARNCRLEAVTT